MLAIIHLHYAITTAGPPGASRSAATVTIVIVRSHATPWNWNRSITAVTLFSRFDNAVTTVAYLSRITGIGATRYAQLSCNWTLPACFDLTGGAAPITIGTVAVITLLTWVKYAISTGAHRSPIYTNTWGMRIQTCV